MYQILYRPIVINPSTKEIVMKVIIMRGIPGSGKSTWVRENACNAVVCSADHYFERSGEYLFNPAELKDAHEACKEKFLAALRSEEELVVVDNTNTMRWEYQFYLDRALQFGYTIQVQDIPLISAELAAQRNTHGVPLDAIQRMIDRWES
jgi:predicted kinase